METIAMMNPFVVGRYVSDKYFCDRKEETKLLSKQIKNGRNVALISPRRLGKTGLIQHLFHQESIEKIRVLKKIIMRSLWIFMPLLH